jgi:hypothetical protein
LSDILAEKLIEINNRFINNALDHRQNTLELEFTIFHLIMGFACAIIGVLFEYID